ncbi:MAG: nucleoside deaminase [Sphingobium sp.]
MERQTLTARAMKTDDHFLRAAIALAHANVAAGGRPFGAVVVRGGEIVATGVNDVIGSHDPTAHAELAAIRAASRTLGTADLGDCAVFASGHPCPMCMAAMQLAGVSAVTYAYSNEDGEPYGLSTAALRAELARPFSEQSMTIRHMSARLDTCPDLYGEWRRRQDARHPG